MVIFYIISPAVHVIYDGCCSAMNSYIYGKHLTTAQNFGCIFQPQLWIQGGGWKLQTISCFIVNKWFFHQHCVYIGSLIWAYSFVSLFYSNENIHSVCEFNATLLQLHSTKQFNIQCNTIVNITQCPLLVYYDKSFKSKLAWVTSGYLGNKWNHS